MHAAAAAHRRGAGGALERRRRGGRRRDIVTQATVRELWCDRAGRVLGVGYERPDGRTERWPATRCCWPATASAATRPWWRELLPEMRDAVFAGHTGNDGSAIAWGRALGARLADLGGCQGHGSWAVPQGALITWALMMEGGVQVNARGERFHDETAGYSEAARAGAGAARRRGLERVRRPAAGAGARLSRTSVAAEAAGACACRRCAGAGRADRLRPAGSCRPRWPAPRVGLQVAAVHAIKVTGALFHTQGGLDIDALPRADAPTARRCPTCWPPAARRAASRATRSGATSRATACSARWPVAPSRREAGES
jgi:fumarate reductase flavoprotein subunit